MSKFDPNESSQQIQFSVIELSSREPSQLDETETNQESDRFQETSFDFNQRQGDQLVVIQKQQSKGRQQSQSSDLNQKLELMRKIRKMQVYKNRFATICQIGSFLLIIYFFYYIVNTSIPERRKQIARTQNREPTLSDLFPSLPKEEDQKFYYSKLQQINVQCSLNQFIYRNNCIDECPIKFNYLEFQSRNFCVSQCPLGNVLIQKVRQCVQQCPDTMVLLNSQYCVNECLQDTQRYKDECVLKCPEGVWEYKNKCVQECPKNAFFVGRDRICADQCPSDLLESKNNCVDVCPQNQRISDQKCVLTCPQGTYYLRESNSCLNQCLYFIYEEECVRACPNKTYPDEQNNCKKIELEKGKFLFKSKQVDQCPLETFIYQQFLCVNSCPQGSYRQNSGRKCFKCDDPLCEQCNDPNGICLKCKNPFYLLGTTCVDNCPHQYLSSDWVCTYLSCQNGYTRRVQFESKILGQQVILQVIAPKRNSQSSNSSPLQTILYFHDFNQNYATLSSYKVNLQCYAVENNTAIISINGRDTMFVNNQDKGGIRYGQFICTELIPYLEEKYGTDTQRESRGIFGEGVGAFGTLQLGLEECYDQFSVLAMMDGIFDNEKISRIYPYFKQQDFLQIKAQKYPKQQFSFLFVNTNRLEKTNKILISDNNTGSIESDQKEFCKFYENSPDYRCLIIDEQQQLQYVQQRDFLIKEQIFPFFSKNLQIINN